MDGLVKAVSARPGEYEAGRKPKVDVAMEDAEGNGSTARATDGSSDARFCKACFDGQYPLDIEGASCLRAIACGGAV